MVNERTVNEILKSEGIVLYNGYLKCEDCGKKIIEVIFEETINTGDDAYEKL